MPETGEIEVTIEYDIFDGIRYSRTSYSHTITMEDLAKLLVDFDNMAVE
jgi:hypothetical protein